jgi:hypothetical protein
LITNLRQQHKEKMLVLFVRVGSESLHSFYSIQIALHSFSIGTAAKGGKRPGFRLRMGISHSSGLKMPERHAGKNPGLRGSYLHSFYSVFCVL